MRPSRFALSARTLACTPVRLASLFPGFLKSRCCNRIHLQKRSAERHHGSWTRLRTPSSSRERPVCFAQLGGVGHFDAEKHAVHGECSRRYVHVWMACLAAVFVALGLSATKWADSYRRRFRWGNSAFLRRLWRCFGHHAVFSRSFPLECISLLCGILLSTGSLQEYPRQTGNLLHRLLTILWRCSSSILFLGGIPYAILHKLNFSACRMEYVLHRYEMNRKLQYIGVEVWLLHVYLTYFSEIHKVCCWKYIFA